VSPKGESAIQRVNFQGAVSGIERDNKTQKFWDRMTNKIDQEKSIRGMSRTPVELHIERVSQRSLSKERQKGGGVF